MASPVPTSTSPRVRPTLLRLRDFGHCGADKYSPVRTTRARIIHLRNDYKDLMSKIEKHLHQHFASLMENADGDQNQARDPAAAAAASEPALRDYVPTALDETFAKVNTIAPSSPAATAGLQPGDLIRNFGWVNQTNHDGLKKVAECVQGNEGVSLWVLGRRDGGIIRHTTYVCLPNNEELLTRGKQREITVKVSRLSAAPSQRELQLTLVPRRDWGGRGLLGCHILPL